MRLWDGAPGHAAKVLSSSNMHSKPVRMDVAAEPASAGTEPAPTPVQSPAEQAMPKSAP